MIIANAVVKCCWRDMDLKPPDSNISCILALENEKKSCQNYNKFYLKIQFVGCLVICLIL